LNVQDKLSNLNKQSGIGASFCGYQGIFAERSVIEEMIKEYIEEQGNDKMDVTTQRLRKSIDFLMSQ
jgi:hypothetical protein